MTTLKLKFSDNVANLQKAGTLVVPGCKVKGRMNGPMLNNQLVAVRNNLQALNETIGKKRSGWAASQGVEKKFYAIEQELFSSKTMDRLDISQGYTDAYLDLVRGYRELCEAAGRTPREISSRYKPRLFTANPEFAKLLVLEEPLRP